MNERFRIYAGVGLAGVLVLFGRYRVRLTGYVDADTIEQATVNAASVQPAS